MTEVPAAHDPVDPDCRLLQPGDQVTLLLRVKEPSDGGLGLPQTVPVPLELVLVGPDVVLVDPVLHHTQGGDHAWPQLHCAATNLASRDEPKSENEVRD